MIHRRIPVPYMQAILSAMQTLRPPIGLQAESNRLKRDMILVRPPMPPPSADVSPSRLPSQAEKR